MTGGERDVQVEERANRILSDARAATAHAAFVETQLRFRRTRARLLARLRRLIRILMVVAAALLSAMILLGPGASPPAPHP